MGYLRTKALIQCLVLLCSLFTIQLLAPPVQAREDVCCEQNILFLDIPDLANDEFEDGLHPNAKGHKKIFEVVKDFLIQQKII